MDSLRYWVTEMHVDGFRFDLASTLARELYAVDRLSAFFDLVQQDPVVSQVKLIAEPWDIGEGGYQVGNFPPLWSEWNGRYRDTIRDFWRGEPATLAEFGYRFTGSSDLYQADTRRPTASVNFVTAHDGFTLRDLVSYNDKHNEANGEDNRDGESYNRSWNCGVEGDDRRSRRARPARPPAPQRGDDAVAVAGRADAARRRRARPHPGRQQQRLLPGHRDLLVRLGRRRQGLPGVVPDGCQDPPPAPRVPPPPVVPGPADPRHRGPRLVPSRRGHDERRRLGQRLRPSRSACSSTATPSRRRTPMVAGSSTTASSSCSTPARPACRWTVPGGKWARDWEVELDTDLAHEPGTEVAAGSVVELAARSMVVLRAVVAPTDVT